ncbi:MAG: hypothetical protein AAFX07_00610 [Pseudomonadota bacterium]
MPGRDTQYEAMAREAADRIDRDHDLAAQLTLLPDEPEPESKDGTRGKGKALSQMREWLASKGYQLPEDQIARMAGLADARDPIAGAMADAERIVAWAFDGKTVRRKEGDVWVTVDAEPTARDFMNAFERCYASRQRAVEALLPYGLAKASPDLGDLPAIPVALVPQAPSTPAQIEDMRDVTPDPARRMVPAQVRHEIEQKQELNKGDIARPTDESRTE